MTFDELILPQERLVLGRCRGRVLDVGAGGGRHSLRLQARGLEVWALDVSPEAARVMRERGVRRVRQGRFLDFAESGFDTALLLGHGLGGDIVVEPYLITLTEEAAPYTGFRHAGVEFIYMLSGAETPRMVKPLRSTWRNAATSARRAVR